MKYSKTLINALIENESAMDRIEAKEIIDCMVEDYHLGEEPEDILSSYGLELDYWLNLTISL